MERTQTIDQRVSDLKGRVKDAIDLLSHGNYDWGKERFAKAAINAGQRRNLRLWKEDSKPMAYMAIASLSYFLGDIRNTHPTPTGHKTTFGRNNHWVLDLWEAALDDLYRDKEFKQQHAKKTPDPAAEQIEGVQPFKQERSLAMRVLDAFTDRDAATMLDLALEIEKIEAQIDAAADISRAMRYPSRRPEQS